MFESRVSVVVQRPTSQHAFHPSSLSISGIGKIDLFSGTTSCVAHPLNEALFNLILGTVRQVVEPCH